MRRFGLVLALVLGASGAVAQDRGRPMSQMQGDCGNFAMNLAAEFALWEQPATSATAAAARPGVTLTPGSPVDLRLLPDGAYALDPPPGQDRRREGTFGGNVTLAFPAAGLWRVSAGPGGSWYDLLGPDGALPDPAFEMQVRCRSIFKSVVFDVPAPMTAVLAINGNRTEVLRILVTPAPR